VRTLFGNEIVEICWTAGASSATIENVSIEHLCSNATVAQTSRGVVVRRTAHHRGASAAALGRTPHWL